MDRTVSLLTLVSGLLPLPDPRQLVAFVVRGAAGVGAALAWGGWVSQL